MVERVFLGWDRPFLTVAADWLLERRDDLPGWLVLVPTSQGGRRLRETLAERAGALLSPKLLTPGALMKTEDPEVAADWMERVAWQETLEEIEDWSAYQELFPEAPDGEGNWAGGLAMEMTGLRHSLQENGLTLTRAARLLSGTVEAGRWEALGRLETLTEQKLRGWGLKSRSRVLSAGVQVPGGISGIVLAGITEMPPLVERALLAWSGPVTVLLGAPESEADAFSELGKPLDCWTERTLPWPAEDWGSVRLVADARQQAEEAWKAVITAQTPSNLVALGSADDGAGNEMTRVFTQGGWTAFHPASIPITGGLPRWLKIWSAWLADPQLSTMADLLALPETSALTGTRRAEKAIHLNRLRNDWMALRPDDLRHRMQTVNFRSDAQRNAAAEVVQAAEALERWRSEFQKGDFIETTTRLLDIILKSSPEDVDDAQAIGTWLHSASQLVRRLDRGPEFWIELMLSGLQSPLPTPPEGRVIDVQGWLEMHLEPGTHLVLCGMNEGNVPARNAGDPWIGEAAGKQLGLPVNSDRAARDAFLYQNLVASRRVGGRVDLICAKSGSGGESLLPSRLLLAADQAELPERVKFLFRGIEPPESGLRWHADWKWEPRLKAIPNRLSVTSFSAWLACPFRFYLKHGQSMQSPEPGRVEWNARDFGNVAHEVMERWGRDTEARDFSKTEAIHAWLSNELDRVAAEWFGRRPPLAVKVQTEVLRHRLSWLARVQACTRAEGWEILEVEHKFEMPIHGSLVVAKIDRIDRHRDSGELRVIDYKTGKVDGVDRSHRKKINTASSFPGHYGPDSPVVHSGEEKGKAADFRWINLQLPLYAVAVESHEKQLPRPCYFTLGNTEAEVDLHVWEDFSESDLQAARDCAEWIVEKIQSGVFWPPAERVAYDDFAVLAAGRAFEELFSPPMG